MPELRRSAEPCSINLHGAALTYTLKRSNARRTLALTINATGLTVHAPWRLPLPEVERFIQQKAGWVHGKLEAASERAVPAVDWHDGMVLPYLGGALRLCVGAHPGHAVIRADTLQLPLRTGGGALRAAVLAWYWRAAQAHFLARLDRFLPLLARHPARLLLSNARTRWGSCTRHGVVRINWRLIQAPPAQIDYVLAHELAHLAHLDHSPAFWREVARLYPGYESAHQGLRAMGHAYYRF